MKHSYNIKEHPLIIKNEWNFGSSLKTCLMWVPTNSKMTPTYSLIEILGTHKGEILPFLLVCVSNSSYFSISLIVGVMFKILIVQICPVCVKWLISKNKDTWIFSKGHIKALENPWNS